MQFHYTCMLYLTLIATEKQQAGIPLLESNQVESPELITSSIRPTLNRLYREGELSSPWQGLALLSVMVWVTLNSMSTWALLLYGFWVSLTYFKSPNFGILPYILFFIGIPGEKMFRSFAMCEEYLLWTQ